MCDHYILAKTFYSLDQASLRQILFGVLLKLKWSEIAWFCALYNIFGPKLHYLVLKSRNNYYPNIVLDLTILALVNKSWPGPVRWHEWQKHLLLKNVNLNGTTTWKENQFSQAVLWLSHVHCGIRVHIHTRTHKEEHARWIHFKNINNRPWLNILLIMKVILGER